MMKSCDGGTSYGKSSTGRAMLWLASCPKEGKVKPTLKIQVKAIVGCIEQGILDAQTSQDEMTVRNWSTGSQNQTQNQISQISQQQQNGQNAQM